MLNSSSWEHPWMLHHLPVNVSSIERSTSRWSSSQVAAVGTRHHRKRLGLGWLQHVQYDFPPDATIRRSALISQVVHRGSASESFRVQKEVPRKTIGVSGGC